MSFVAIASFGVGEYARHKAKIVYFENCEYCQRAPDHCQADANCKSCGAPLRQKSTVRLEAPRLDFYPPAFEIAKPAPTPIPEVQETPAKRKIWPAIRDVLLAVLFGLGLAMMMHPNEMLLILQWVFSK